MERLFKEIYKKYWKRENNPQEDPQYFPPGHFHSPVPDVKQIRSEENRIWGDIPEGIKGINLYVEEQLRLLEEFSTFYKDLPFKDKKQSPLRYYYLNQYYTLMEMPLYSIP